MTAPLPRTTRVRPRTAGRRAPLAAVRLLAIALTTVVPLLAAGVAHGHARLTRSVPKEGAVLPASPASIEMWFNELLDDEFNAVAVHRAKDGAPADQADLASGPPVVDEADRTHLTTPVGTLAPGEYVVQWKVLSRDGHSARGRLRFRVAGE